ncbi:MAG TPA: ATP-binding protein [Sphingomonadaceae bacterium]|nr:ATP-binding protein [Sphingomonadaceae bacterium]
MIFLLSTGAAFAAQSLDRHITSAVVYVLGVTLIGSVAGVRSGLGAAVAASIIYNFFLSQPVFRFSISSADEYVPLIVFNLSAIVSGLLAGRLKDRAHVAEEAQRQLRLLLAVSSRLQSAVRVAEISAALSETAEGLTDRLELYVVRDGALESLGSSTSILTASQMLDAQLAKLVRGHETAFLLSASEQAVGVLILRNSAATGQQRFDIEALVNLLGIAVERCLLLERLAEAEAVKRSEQFKTSLLSSVSHDMRTPLAAISASASSLTDYGDELPAVSRRDLLIVIETQCARLNRYTTNLLNLGRIQAGFEGAAFTDIDAVEGLGAAITRAREVAHHHVFEKAISPDYALMRGDPVMLEQMFFNVLDNAVRYSAENSRIGVAANVTDGRLVVEITDDGPGISPADLGRIFERFYRGGAVLRDGSGLGLAISKGFAEAFGGSIWAESPVSAGGGTRVVVELPLSKQQFRGEP